MASARVLVVSNFTIDLIEERSRIGGPGYYCCRALTELGAECYALGHVSEEYRGLVLGVLNLYGIRALEIPSRAMPIFTIDKGRAAAVRGESPKIDLALVEAHAKTVRADIVVFSPVMGEIGSEDVKNFRRGFQGLTALDIQGLVRRKLNDEIGLVWSHEVEEAVAEVDLVHGNINEFAFSRDEIEVVKRLRDISTVAPRTVIFASIDHRGSYAIRSGEVYLLRPPDISPVDDVGAGDIMLSVAALYMHRGLGWLEAAAIGVAAAALKVENAYRDVWLREEEVRAYSEIVLSRAIPVNI